MQNFIKQKTLVLALLFFGFGCGGGGSGGGGGGNPGLAPDPDLVPDIPSNLRSGVYTLTTLLDRVNDQARCGVGNTNLAVQQVAYFSINGNVASMSNFEPGSNEPLDADQALLLVDLARVKAGGNALGINMIQEDALEGTNCVGRMEVNARADINTGDVTNDCQVSAERLAQLNNLVTAPPADGGRAPVVETTLIGCYDVISSFTGECPENLRTINGCESLAALVIQSGNHKQVEQAPPDRDGDGIPDADDRCPDDPARGGEAGDEDECAAGGGGGDGDGRRAGPFSNELKLSIFAGGKAAFVTKADGTVWAWGQIGYEPSSVEERIAQIDAAIVAIRRLNPDVDQEIIDRLEAQKRSAQADYNAAVLKAGIAFSSLVPVQLFPDAGPDSCSMTNISSIDSGFDHAIAVKQDGTVCAVGLNSVGQLGNGSTTKTMTPVLIEDLVKVKSVAVGNSHNIALDGDGWIRSWGDPSKGLLGYENADAVQSKSPKKIDTIGAIKQVEASDTFSAALTHPGRVYVWGSAVLQDPRGGAIVQNSVIPVVIQGVENIKAIAAGNQHLLMITQENEVKAWGSGWLGDNHFHMSKAFNPVNIPGIANVKAIAAGRDHSVVLTESGEVFTWGSDFYGQLGNGPNNQTSLVPQKIQALNGIEIVAIAAASNYSMALDADGNVWTWGQNTYGQLGRGNTEASPIPVKVMEGL